jgi:hypothetical protein
VDGVIQDALHMNKRFGAFARQQYRVRLVAAFE